jgi:hypothetical protein
MSIASHFVLAIRRRHQHRRTDQRLGPVVGQFADEEIFGAVVRNAPARLGLAELHVQAARPDQRRTVVIDPGLELDPVALGRVGTGGNELLGRQIMGVEDLPGIFRRIELAHVCGDFRRAAMRAELRAVRPAHALPERVLGKSPDGVRPVFRRHSRFGQGLSHRNI